MPEKLSQGPRIGHDSRVGAGLSRGPGMGKKLTAAPWSGTWPAPSSTLDLDFANNRGWVRGVGQGGVMDAITFTRASTGTFVNEQGLLEDAVAGQPRFDWASTQQLNGNLLTATEEFDTSVWQKGTATTILANAAIAPDGTNTADQILGTANVRNTSLILEQQIYTFSIYAKISDTIGTVVIGVTSASFLTRVTFDIATQTFSNIGANVAGYGYESASSGWYRVWVVQNNPISGSVGINSSSGNPYIWGAQLEFGDTVTTYKRQGLYNATNTPLLPTPTCNGLLIEEARTNRILWNRDATQTQWVKTNVTAAKDQTGIDGVANAASSLTSTSADGTCIQTITLASGARTGSVYLKRITGTGNVQVSLDGSTWSTVDLSDTDWRRIVLSGTVTNPTVGIRLATSGDAVAMDYAQVEDGAFATSPVLTTTAAGTRAADVATVPLSSTWYNQGSQTVVSSILFTNYVSGSGFFGGIVGFGAVSPRITVFRGTATDRPYASQIFDGTRNRIARGENFNDSANGVLHKIALSYDNASSQMSVDGVSGAPINSGYAGTPNIGTNMQIGNRPDSNVFLNGWISRLTIIPKLFNVDILNQMTGPSK